ncbi:hypothetical protein IF2G_04727 [Cordyceps javanica]|nr:hypothetical protein IF2G_04727 [Cordyceps javanica]
MSSKPCYSCPQATRPSTYLPTICRPGWGAAGLDSALATYLATCVPRYLHTALGPDTWVLDSFLPRPYLFLLSPYSSSATRNLAPSFSLSFSSSSSHHHLLILTLKQGVCPRAPYIALSAVAVLPLPGAKCLPASVC